MIYFIIFIFLFFLVLNFDFGVKKTSDNFWYKIAGLTLILVSGLRYKVGGDTLAYFDFFESYPSFSELKHYDFTTSRWDPMWVILSAISKSIYNDFTLFQIIHATFINLIVFKFVKNNTQYKFTAVLIYYLFFYIYFNTEIMRESLAVCFFLLAYPYYKSKSLVKYYLFTVVAFLFHSSAIITLLFPVFRYVSFNKKGVFVLLGVFIVLNAASYLIPSALNFLLISDRLSGRFDIYSELKVNWRGMLQIFILYALFPYVVLYFNKNILKRTELFKELYFLYFAIVTVVIVISGFARVINYLAPFMFVLYADVIVSAIKRQIFMQHTNLVVFIIFIVSFVPKINYYRLDMSRFYAGTVKFNMYYPYSSVFFPEEYPFREILFREGQREGLEEKQQ